MHQTPMWLAMSTIHSDLVFDNAGICGGYVRHPHWACRCNSVDARASLPLLLHTLDAGDRPLSGSRDVDTHGQ
jgi:hypothetical protein